MTSNRGAYLRRTPDADEDDELPLRFQRDNSNTDYSSSAHRSGGDDEEGDDELQRYSYSSSAALRCPQRDESLDTSTVVSSRRDRVTAALSQATDDGKDDDDSAGERLNSEVVEEDHLDDGYANVSVQRQQSGANDEDADENQYKSAHSAREKVQCGQSVDTEPGYENGNAKQSVDVPEDEQNENENKHGKVEVLSPPKADALVNKRAPLKRDFTQNSVSKEGRNTQVDENDWARRNQGRNKVLGLIAKFSNPGTVSNASQSYKTEHGIAKVGQIKQSKFQ